MIYDDDNGDHDDDNDDTIFLFKLLTKKIALRGHSFSTYAKFSEKLTFLNRWYADVCTVIDRTYHRNASEAVL